jgi:hypothetical protein
MFARAEEVILALNELVERIEKGEIGVKDFASRAFFSRGASGRRIRRQSRKAGG